MTWTFYQSDGAPVGSGGAGYTDAEAIAAVEGEATLDLTGDVTIDGAKTLAVDVINEKDSAAGVTVDGVLLKDGLVDGIDVAARDHAVLVLSDNAPTTQAHSDSAAAGSGTQPSRDDHGHGMPAAGGFTIHAIPASVSVAVGDTQVFVSMFSDTAGTPDRCIVLTILSPTTVALIEYRRVGDAWVFDPADCARDTEVTLNFTCNSQDNISAFAIDNPAGTGDRILFVAGNEDLATDEFEISSIVLTPGGTSLTATAVVIAGANQPTDTTGIATCGIPLSTTRCMTFYKDDAHFADITEAAGTYTFTYDDAKVLAVDTTINVFGTFGKTYSGKRIGAQVVLMRAGSTDIGSDNFWEMSITAVLIESFEPMRVGLMGSDQGLFSRAPTGMSAIGGSFAVASPVGGDGVDGNMSPYLVFSFPLDSI